MFPGCTCREKGERGAGATRPVHCIHQPLVTVGNNGVTVDTNLVTAEPTCAP